MSKCALCASVLLYSRDQCIVALGLQTPARSHRVYWAHCTLCAMLHCLVPCTALHCTVCAVLHCTA